MFELKEKGNFAGNTISSGLKAHQTFSLGQWLTEQDHQTSSWPKRRKKGRNSSPNSKEMKAIFIILLVSKT
jgi:hypothetical protein